MCARALVLVLVLGSCALVAACGGYPSGGRAPGDDRPCADDFDCAGERICVHGECVDPYGGAGGSAGGGAGGSAGGGAGCTTPGCTGGGDCVSASAGCGCPGAGYTMDLTEFSYFRCDDQGSGVSLTRDGQIVYAGPTGTCVGTALPCEIAGLGRLFDQAFTGCAPVEQACTGAFGGTAFHLCAGTSCVVHPAGTGACGEFEILQALEQLLQRVLVEGSCQDG